MIKQNKIVALKNPCVHNICRNQPIYVCIHTFIHSCIFNYNDVLYFPFLNGDFIPVMGSAKGKTIIIMFDSHTIIISDTFNNPFDREKQVFKE